MKNSNWLLVVGLVFTMAIISCNDDDPVDPNQIAFNNASFSKGGIMYDKFWSTEAGFDQSNAHLANLNGKADFFRCKQCHGWDGLGSNGAYINRGPTTTRPRVSGLNLYDLAKTKTSKELFDALKVTNGRRDISFDLSTYDPATNYTEGDKMPNLNQLLTDAQIWDIVKFMKEGMFDVKGLYDATYTGTYPTGSATFSNIGKDGIEATGNSIYAAKCASCHGASGTTLDLEGKTLGNFARSKANEAQHKIKYGQLGSSMVGNFNMTLTEMKDLYKALSNTTNFPN